MFHSHTLLPSKLVISWIAVALSQASNGLTPMRVCMYIYLNQTDVDLTCTSNMVPDWTFNGTLINVNTSPYSFTTSHLVLTIHSVQNSTEGTFRCVANNTDLKTYMLVVLGTLQFYSSSESILNTRVLDTSVWVTNAGPGLYVAPTNFTLFAQGSSPPCCNQSEVQVPLPFTSTNTTYTLGHTNCTNVTCTYVATLQASPITSITPSAVFKTFTVTITPTDNIPTPTQSSPPSDNIPTPTQSSPPSDTPLIAGLTAGVVSLLFISVTTIALTIWVTKYRLKSSSMYALKKRPSSVELNLGTNVEARFSSQTSKESPV